MKVMMTGGGTGGHVNPALAIAGNIKQNQPDAEIIFVGTSHGIENKLVPKEGYKLEHVEVQGFKRSPRTTSSPRGSPSPRPSKPKSS